MIFRHAVMHMHALMDLYTHTFLPRFYCNDLTYISGAPLYIKLKMSKHDLRMNDSASVAIKVKVMWTHILSIHENIISQENKCQTG